MKTRLKIIWIAMLVLPLLGSLQIASAYYDPSAQRWVNRDPIGELGFEWAFHRNSIQIEESNRHIYLKNSPINKWDSFGLCPAGCLGADPEGSDSKVCSQYGDRRYLEVDLSCFCRCAGDSDWSNAVRGCLACMDGSVSDTTAHATCYAAADEKYKRPNIVIAFCTAKCK